MTSRCYNDTNAPGLEALEILACFGEVVGGEEEFARVCATGCSELIDSSVVSVLLVSEGQKAVLHIHAGRPPTQQELTSLRDEALERFATLGHEIDEDDLRMAISGEPIRESAAKPDRPKRVHHAIGRSGRRPKTLVGLVSIQPSQALSAEEQRLAQLCAARIARPVGASRRRRRAASSSHDRVDR